MRRAILKRLKEGKDFWRRYRRNRAAVLGLLLFLFMLLSSIFAPIFWPDSPLSTNAGALISPNWRHPFGTDDLGRDIYSGVINGGRISLTVGFLAASISTIIGILIGAVSGYFGGKIDYLLMRVTEAFMIIPAFMLAIVIVAIYGATVWNVILVISVLSWPGTARLVRADFLSLKGRDFVEAAHVLGLGNAKIIFSEILPNAMIPVIINGTFQVAYSIIIEASLSFLGLVDPNVVSWGLMLRRSMPFLRQAWWTALFPGLAIFITVLCINLVGDGINEALSPYLRER